MAEHAQLSTPITMGEERAKAARISYLIRLRMQERPKNTADAVLRPTKGGLRFSVTHKFAFLVQTDPIVSGRFVRGRDQRSTGWHAS